jgi:fucose 4-O-acetylase-like acetyltransferase
MLYGNGNNGMLGYNVVLWFLPCLFITKLTFAAITRRITQTNKIMIILFTSAAVGSLLSIFLPWIKLPFGFESALSGLPFLGAGYLFTKHKELLHIFKKYKLIVATIALFFTAIFATMNFSLSGSQIDLRVNQLDNIPLFYLGAFAGIISWTAISQIINKNAFLEYIGQHSLVIFAWHNILLVDLRTFVGSFLKQDILESIHPIMSTLYVCMAISIILFSRILVVKLKAVYQKQ